MVDYYKEAGHETNDIHEVVIQMNVLIQLLMVLSEVLNGINLLIIIHDFKDTKD